MNTKFLKVIILLAVLTTVVLTGCGAMSVGREVGEEIDIPTTMPVQIDPEKLFQMNEETMLCDVGLTATALERTEDVSEGWDLVVITVNLINNSGKQAPINAFDFTLVDSENKTHTDAMASVEQPLGSPRLEDEDSVTGMLTYRVPAGDSDIHLIWQPGWCTGVVYIDVE